MKKIIALALSAVMAISMVACGEKAETHELKIGRVQGAAHGTKCFASVTAVVEGDKVVAAYIDEYQFGTAGDVVGVPNSESLAANLAEGKVLYSKRANDEYYSANMANNAGSTVALGENYNAIQAHVAGKTIAELETLVAGEAEAVVDAVAGCTLVDAKGYITVIIEAAKAAQANTAVTFEGSLEGAKLNTVLAAAHGTKCWTETSAFVVGDKVVLAYIDEYQYGNTADVTAVPNATELAANFAEGKVAYSKRVNNAYYSANMANNAGATVELAAGYDAIQAHVAGKTIAELETLVAGEATAVVDAIAGCTLVDAQGYVNSIIAAAK